MEIDTILRNFIAGERVEESVSMPAINPATGERIALLPRSSRETAERAVAAARGAQAAWAAKSIWERSQACVAIASSIDASRARIARTVSLEQGSRCRRQPARSPKRPTASAWRPSS